MSNPYGLIWVPEFLCLAPRWSEKPDIAVIDKIARKHLDIPQNEILDVALLAEGSFNKVYKITTTSGAFVMRVALPLDPLKVESEIVTMDWVRSSTSIPIPEVIAYNTSAENELRFPFMLMRLAPGRPLSESWRWMGMDKKRRLLKQYDLVINEADCNRLANFQAQLFSQRFDTAGSLTHKPIPPNAKLDIPSLLLLPFLIVFKLAVFAISTVALLSPTSIVAVGRIVTHDHVLIPSLLPLGPYRSSYEMLKARLERRLDGLAKEMAAEEDEDDREELEMLGLCTQLLLVHLPRIHSPEAVESMVLPHQDLHAGNILINEDTGEITAILDWEFTQTVPLWAGTSFPKLIEGHKRLIEPDPDFYHRDEDDVANDQRDRLEGKSATYWEAREEYENTILRADYVEEMERLVPGWKALYKSTKFERTFEREIMLLESGMPPNYDMVQWLEAWDGGCMTKEGKGWPEPLEDTLCCMEQLVQ